jgi:hypothetical protein
VGKHRYSKTTFGDVREVFLTAQGPAAMSVAVFTRATAALTGRVVPLEHDPEKWMLQKN